MKTKTILILSLTVNAVLLATFGYFQSLSAVPAKSPPIIYFVNRSNPEGLSTALKAVAGETSPD